MSDFTYRPPDPKTFLHTLRRALEGQGRREIAMLLIGAECEFVTAGHYSRVRWDGYDAELRIRVPVDRLARFTDLIRRELLQWADKILPSEVGYDLSSVEISPFLEVPPDDAVQDMLAQHAQTEPPSTAVANRASTSGDKGQVAFVQSSGTPSVELVAARDGTRPIPDAPSDDAYDIAVICALHEKELDSILKTGQGPWQIRHVEDDPTSYYETTYLRISGPPLRVVAAAAPQMGMPASAVLTTKMILHFTPRLVAMVGLAAGFDSGKQGFGDILVPDTTFDYGSGKLVPQGDGLKFMPDAKPLTIEPRLAARLLDWKRERRHLDAIRAAWQADKPRTILDMHIGPLGSGSAVLESKKPLSDVVEHWRKLTGVEMEAYGVHLACQNARTPKPWFLCMKSICDFAADKADSWQAYAAFTAAQFFYRFVTEEWDTLSPPPASSSSSRRLEASPPFHDRTAAPLTPLSEAEANATIARKALAWDTTVGVTTVAIPSVNGTHGYYALEAEGIGVIYCHADGPRRGRTFRVRQGIGWHYQTELFGAASRLGLPISDEEPTSTGAVHHFEAGFIEWDSQTSAAQAYLGEYPDRTTPLHPKLARSTPVRPSNDQRSADRQQWVTNQPRYFEALRRLSRIKLESAHQIDPTKSATDYAAEAARRRRELEAANANLETVAFELGAEFDASNA